MKYIYRYGILVCCTSCANCDDGHSEQKHAQNQNNNPSKFNKKEIQDPENIKKEFLEKFNDINDVINNFYKTKQTSNNKLNLQDADIEKLRKLDKFIGEKYDDIIKIKENSKNCDQLFSFCINNKQEKFNNILKYLIQCKKTFLHLEYRGPEKVRFNFFKNCDYEILKIYFDSTFYYYDPIKLESKYIGDWYLRTNTDVAIEIFNCKDFNKVKLLVDSVPEFVTSTFPKSSFEFILCRFLEVTLHLDYNDITHPSILDNFLPSLNFEQTKYFFDKYPEYKISAIGLLFYLYQNAGKLENFYDHDLQRTFNLILSRFEAYDELLKFFTTKDWGKRLFEFTLNFYPSTLHSIDLAYEKKNKPIKKSFTLLCCEKINNSSKGN